MSSPARRLLAAALLAALAVAPAAGLTAVDVDAAALRATRGLQRVTRTLASDKLRGRDNDTAESLLVQRYLLPRLARIGRPLLAGAGADRYRQGFVQSGQTGTNLLAVIRGRELPDEYVIVGAHYDHLDTRSAPSGRCSSRAATGGEVCNGATDNATSVAAVLAVGRAIRSLPTPPRRSVVLALWDAEEDGLLGSRAYAGAPAVPLAQTAAYVNLDILGATLLPSVRAISFVVGSETGGAIMRQIVAAAVDAQSIDARFFSYVFGQLRSDYATFGEGSIPTVFFSDSTGGCYHTTGDDVGIVDFDKLAEQSAIVLRTVIGLAEAPARPTFVPPMLAVFEDAVSLQHVLTTALPDLSLFGAAQQEQLLSTKQLIDQIVAAGEIGFDESSVVATLQAAMSAIDILTGMGCHPFRGGARHSG